MIQIQDVSFEYEKEQGTLSHIDLNIMCCPYRGVGLWQNNSDKTD